MQTTREGCLRWERVLGIDQAEAVDYFIYIHPWPPELAERFHSDDPMEDMGAYALRWRAVIAYMNELTPHRHPESSIPVCLLSARVQM